MNLSKTFLILLVIVGLTSCHHDDVKNTYTISGKVNPIYSFNSHPFPGEFDTLYFTVKLISNDQIIATTDDSVFTFSGLEEGKSYTVIPEQLETEGIGMTAIDLIMVRKFIEGVQELDAFQILAADVNKNNVVDSTDLALIENCLLDTKDCFSWRFATEDYDGTGNGQADQYIINDLMSDVTILLLPINTGDVSGTHNPN